VSKNWCYLEISYNMYLSLTFCSSTSSSWS